MIRIDPPARYPVRRIAARIGARLPCTPLLTSTEAGILALFALPVVTILASLIGSL